MTRAAFSYRIEGRVQGVGFRWWTVREARSLGLDGWVRNRQDGSVEAFAAGDAEALARFAEACRQGPPGAQVTGLHIAAAADDGVTGFIQRETA